MARASTIYDVARQAKVAPSTVSRAFSRPERLNQATVDTVLSVASSLNFSPNRTARSLSTGRTKNVAMFVPNISNPFFSDLMRSFHETARERGYSLFLVDTEEKADFDMDLLRQMATKTDGVALIAPRLSQADLTKLVAVGNYVVVNREVPGIAAVTIDSSQALSDAISDLHQLGHQRLVYARGPVGGRSDKIRRARVRELCDRLDMEVVITPERPDDAATAAAALGLVRRTKSTAVMTHSDFAAIALLAECQQHSIDVPGDISIVGHDGVHLGALMYPPLSTIDAKTKLTGTAAATALIDLIEHPDEQPTKPAPIAICADYLKRGSTGQAAAPRRLSPAR